jgi:hypothetical protein
MHHISRLLTTNWSYVVEGVHADCVQIGSDRFWWGEHSGGQRTRDKREDAINCSPHPRFGLFGLFGPRPLFVLFVGLSFVSSSACQKVRNFAWSHGLLVPRSSKKNAATRGLPRFNFNWLIFSVSLCDNCKILHSFLHTLLLFIINRNYIVECCKMLWKTCIALSLIVGTKLFYDVIVRFNVCLRKKVQRNGMVKIMSSISSIEKKRNNIWIEF